MDDTSRSARKRESEALQKLGTELVRLHDQELARISLPPELAEAVALARRLPKGGGLRRQMQHIGALMRRIDAEPIRTALDALRHEWADAAGALHEVEHWRDRLLHEGDAAIDALLREHPAGDAARLRRLIAEARHDSAANKPPRAARELFRYLRDAVLR
ncbi:MAG: ribosome biogenesis factor YjgA [Thiohalomonadaceae bacterium]